MSKVRNSFFGVSDFLGGGGRELSFWGVTDLFIYLFMGGLIFGGFFFLGGGGGGSPRKQAWGKPCLLVPAPYRVEISLPS